MKLKIQYLIIRCRPENLDSFIVRSRIKEAIDQALPLFQGVVLDIGCGYMPYKPLILNNPSQAVRYIGLDLANNIYQKPDLEWDGQVMPLQDASIDCALATEVFEHCPEPEIVMRETWRVLKPGGFLFFTVPFLWPLHTVPHDEYRYTPFSLHRHLAASEFIDIDIKPLGGWDASMAQMLGLWVRRRSMNRWIRAGLSYLFWPLVWLLSKIDRYSSTTFKESAMITGLSGTARKP